MASRLAALGCLLTTLLVAATAAAEPETPRSETKTEGAAGEATVKTLNSTEAAKPQDAVKPQDSAAEEPTAVAPAPTPVKSDPDKDAAVADAAAGDSAAELPGKTYYFIGARYRGLVVPKFMENLFADGGKSVYVHAVGPEFAIRKDGFEYNLSTWFAFYNVDDMAFKGKNDPVAAWELLSAKMTLLYITSDFLWSHEFTPEIALNYGIGAGLGLVFGNLYRTQSYPTQNGQDPSKYAKCTGPLQGAGFVGGTQYCDDSNNHYGFAEPNWANGGSKPIIFPWLALQTGLRFKLHRSFAGRLDLGFGTSGFFFGIGADYGL
jgi:hypothetical protein